MNIDKTARLSSNGTQTKQKGKRGALLDGRRGERTEGFRIEWAIAINKLEISRWNGHRSVRVSERREGINNLTIPPSLTRAMQTVDSARSRERLRVVSRVRGEEREEKGKQFREYKLLSPLFLFASHALDFAKNWSDRKQWRVEQRFCTEIG